MKHAEHIFRRLRKPEVFAGLILIAVWLAIAGYNQLASRPQPAVAPPPADGQAAAAVAPAKPAGIVRAGVVRQAEAVPVDSDYSGKIVEVYVKEGETVKAGQPLLRLEASAAGGGTDRKPVAVPPGQDSYENARTEYLKYQRLYEQGAIPRRQLENAAARLQAVEQNLKSGRAAAIPYSGPVTVKAPVDGIVAGLTATAGSSVQAGQQLAALGSGQAVEVVAPLGQKDLYQIPLGAPVVAETADTKIAGRVASIFPDVRDNKVVSFQARIILLDPPAGLLQPGLAATVRFETDQ